MSVLELLSRGELGAVRKEALLAALTALGAWLLYARGPIGARVLVVLVGVGNGLPSFLPAKEPLVLIVAGGCV